MQTAVSETARVLMPPSTSISNGIMSSINIVIGLLQRRRDKRAVADLANMLRAEYPYESSDYILNMAFDLVRENRNG